MFSYCVFCERNRSGFAAAEIARQFGVQALDAKRERLKWVRRQPIREEVPLLPGYLFLYAEREIEDPEQLRRVPGVLRLLGDAECGYALAGGDEAFAHLLLSTDGVLGRVQVIEAGQRVRVAIGAMEGIQAQVIAVDRRGGRVQLALPFAGQSVRLWVEYEMVEAEAET